ncbi:MAG: hypothetical protein IJW29_03590 [Clostridia bacterium]|nr:hypothetical protein [Clostridia bacterium]
MNASRTDLNGAHGIPLCVGYSLTGEGQFTFPEIVARNRNAIGEVYFPWIGLSSGRSPFGQESGYVDYSAGARLERELCEIAKMGVGLDLLLNANCNGADALSRAHEREVCSVLEHLYDIGCAPRTVTTASPVTAQIVKRFDPAIDVRASVNMRVGSVKGIQYVEHLFDSFCVLRDINRDLEALSRVSEYLHKNGKKVILLANSGCLRNCSMQTFHDNAVAHEREIFTKDNLPWAGASGCRAYLARPEHRVAFLQNTWVRPEDLWHYKGLVDGAKLATRMHALPTMVIDAYAKGVYHGNLADLCEPGHGPTFAPFVIDNDRFPADWFARTTACDKQCERCEYCESVKDLVFVNTDH